MKENLILIFVAFLIILVMDFIWLGFIIGDFFKSQIGHISNIVNGNFKINYFAALFVYVLMAISVIVFLLPQVNSIQKAIFLGFLFGFVLYGVFDGTNLSFVKDYPVKFVIVDVLWGSFLMSVVTVLTYLFKLRFL